MDMSKLITWGAKAHADRTAFVFQGKEWTFSEINRRTDRLAHGLLRIGVARGDPIAVLVGNRPEYAVSEFAVTKAGAIRVPLLATSTSKELIRWLDGADIAFVIACPAGIDVLRSVREKTARPFTIVAVESAGEGEFDLETLIADSPEGPVDVELTPDDLYAIRFTGGTTGAPKGIVMSHRNMVTVMMNALLSLQIQKTDVGLTLHPMTHACGFFMYYYWMMGAKNIIHPAFNFKVSNFVAAVEQHRVTSIMMIPTLLNIILDAPESKSVDFSSIRHIIYGGAPIPLPRLEHSLLRFGPVFQQIYGSSESPMLMASLLRDEHLRPDGSKPTWFGSVGREVINVEIKVADETGTPVPVREIGEIMSRGEHTMVGYWRNPELTTARYQDGWIRTGDMGYFDENRYLFLVDRKEDMIITGGFNVWPAEIEDVLYSHPAVLEGCVFGVEDPKWGEAVCALAVLRTGSQASETEIIAYMAERLTNYKVPKRIVISSEAMPKSGVGKLLRRQARERFLAAVATSSTSKQK